MVAFIVFFLLSPYVILITKFSAFNLTNISEVTSVFTFTFIQASLSALVSTLIGILVGISLSAIHEKKYYKWVELACYLPCFVPVLFIVFSVLNISQIFNFSVSGLFGIVSMHSIINIGLVGILYSKVIFNKAGLSNQIGLVQGVSTYNYLFRVLLPLTAKDIIFILTSIFLFSFTSFSIPLIIGGISSTTVELLIYEKLIISNSVEQATLIAILQFVFLVFFMLLANRVELQNSKTMGVRVPFFKYKYFIVIPCLITCALMFGLFFNLNLNIFGVIDFDKIAYSLFVALATGYAMFMFCQVLLVMLPSKFLNKFLLSYSSPSTVLVGLAFLVLFKENSDLKILCIFLIYIILFLPFLYKMFIQSYLENLTPSLKLSKVMSASTVLKFKMISFPLGYNICLFVAFLTSVWVMGDYAVSSLIFDSNTTLALEAKSLMRSYKMDEASNVIIIILICEFILFIIYKGLLSVSNKKS